MNAIDKCLCIAPEQEAFLKFHYKHPNIYLELKALANKDRARGEKSLDIQKLLARIHDPALERLRRERADAAMILCHYRILLESDFCLWKMFRSGG